VALSQKVGHDSKVAAYVETGQRLPTVATIARLASGLGVSAAWLGYGLGDMMTNGSAATCDQMGARLQAMRVERGLTKKALAKLVKLSPSTVADIENGAQTGVEVVEALAQVLDASPGWIAFNQGPRLPPSRRGRPRSAPVSPDPAG
jgi:transcriptional regulator with XRE-family HTH domain